MTIVGSNNSAGVTSSNDPATSPYVEGRFNDMIAGAFAGFVGRLITAPFDVLKIRFQLQHHGLSHQQVKQPPKYTSIMQAIKLLVKEEGLGALWKGNLSATYLWVAYAMIQFSSYGIMKKIAESVIPPQKSVSVNAKTHLNGEMGEASHDSSSTQRYSSTSDSTFSRHHRKWHTLSLFLAGAVAGITATVATYPLDIMRTQFAIQGNSKTYLTLRSFVVSTFQKRGFKGFYAGVAPAVVGIAPYMGLNFAIYELLKDKLDDKGNGPLKALKESMPLLGNLVGSSICGAIAGGASKVVVYPLDTIKKRLQMQTLVSTFVSPVSVAGAGERVGGMVDCARSVLRREGLSGFYRGVGPTFAKSFVSAAATFAAYDAAKEFLRLRERTLPPNLPLMQSSDSSHKR